MNDPVDDSVTLEELETLQEESRQRQAALRELAAALPAAQSRRSLVAQMCSDLIHAPDKPEVARRLVAKIARTPLDLLKQNTR